MPPISPDSIYYILAITAILLSPLITMAIKQGKLEEISTRHDESIKEHAEKLEGVHRLGAQIATVETLVRAMNERFDRLERITYKG